MKIPVGFSAIMIAGATASGKSALALKLAQEFQGEIINADSMQLYQELPILTACPSSDERALCPHHLYQVYPASQACSVKKWQEQVQILCAQIQDRGNIPIIVGGTGLYLYALEHGIANMPEINPRIRQDLKHRLKDVGIEALYEELMRLDPASGYLVKYDQQRILRALEVVQGTGHSLRYWQEQSPEKAPSLTFYKLLLFPSREDLLQRAQNRWQTMVDKGGIDETLAWLRQGDQQATSLYKALGVRECHAYDQGLLSKQALDDAVMVSTRRYIKRQRTWFRHRFKAHEVFEKSPPGFQD